MDSSAYYGTTTEDEGRYYEADYGYQDEAAALPVDVEPFRGYGQVSGATHYTPEPPVKQVEPDVALLMAVENFHTLKSTVPDADNHHLWELAQDCVRKEDNAQQYAKDLLSTGDYPLEGYTDFGEQDDGAFLTATKYSFLRGIFPDAATSWVWEAAQDHANSSEEVFGIFIIRMQETGDYLRCNLDGLPAPAKIEVKKRELTRFAQEILNTIDPEYIDQQLNTDTAMGYNEQGVSEIILKCMNNAANCPSKSEDYYRRVTQGAIEQYSGDFDIEKFLLRFPEPAKYFENPVNAPGPKYRADVFKYLRVVAPQYTQERIRTLQKEKKYLISCHRWFFGSQVPINTIGYQLTDECARFINELTYIRYYELIIPTAAVYASLLDTVTCPVSEEWEDFPATQPMYCELCSETIPCNKLLQCTEAHVFCEECVRQWVNERLENGHVQVNCLQLCAGTIPDDAMKRVLPANAVEQLIKRRQEQEIGQAGLEGIISCRWCDYSYVPRSEDQDLICLSPECGERWCKKCKQLAHHPNPCEDTPDEVRKRVFIEERMTKAAVRTCPQCGTCIVKIDGCDHVTCKCGAGVCYNCGQLATHHHCGEARATFNVQAAGHQAKNEAEHLFPNIKLNHDPTRFI